MEKHSTPLYQHIKEKHLWLDVSVLVVLWIVAMVIPKHLALGDLIALHLIFKIMALFATLELMSFLLFHFISGHRGLLLQGLLGGFISSTATYIQILGNEKFSKTNIHATLNALLLAKIAMLVEAIFIVLALIEHNVLMYITPFLVQLLALTGYLIWSLSKEDKSTTKSTSQLHVGFDHPIIWKNVLKLSALILILISTMHYLEKYLKLPEIISVLLVSLFEAHSVLASVLIKYQSMKQVPENLEWILIMVLTGSTLSKMALTLKSQNFTQKRKLVIILAFSALVSILFKSFN
jgi:uncharacterized membrane protein (DUF4010 family)